MRNTIPDGLSPLGVDVHEGRSYPILPAYRDGTTLLVWCAHERKWHTHGLGNGRAFGTGDGHRVAHCSCHGSPLYDRGYVIQEVGEMTPAIRRSARPTRGYECPTCR